MPPLDSSSLAVSRRRIVSVLFLATVLMGVSAGTAYLAGRSNTPVNAAKPVVAPSASTTITTHIQAAPASAPVVTAVVERDPVDPGRAPAVELFHDPVPGATYVQVGALDPGVAEVYVEVLRRKGFEAFGAPGPNKDTIRVLVGPMPNSNAVNEAREKLAASGFQSFARTYPVIVSR